MDYRHQEYDPPDAATDEGLWQVHLAIEPSEREAIRAVAATVLPLEQLDVHAEVSEGDVIVAIRVYAKTSDEAVELGGYLLRKIRAAAGLPQAPTRTLGYISPWWKRSTLIADLSKEAHALHQQGRHDLAVVRIQTACELTIVQALTVLLAKYAPEVALRDLIQRKATLRDPASRALLHVLTGKRIQAEPWWEAYGDHVKRRDAIVHAGLAVTHSHAVESLTVSLELSRWLDARAVEPSDPA